MAKIKSLVTSRKFTAGVGFLFGFALGYYLGLVKAHKLLDGFSMDFSWLSWLGDITPDPTFLSDVAAIEGVLIGVSIPICLQVVGWTADRYRDQEIAKFFLEERLYRIQYFLFFLNIVLALLLRFLNIQNLLILWFTFLWFIANIIIFCLFIRLVEQYATDTDKVVLGKLKDYVQDILEK